MFCLGMIQNISLYDEYAIEICEFLQLNFVIHTLQFCLKETDGLTRDQLKSTVVP